MKNLIPQYIQEKYLENGFQGELEAVVMHLCMTGYTALTATLLEKNEGAEFLSEILKEFFEPMVAAVHERGGYIADFVGDVVTAIFPKEGGLDACYAARTVQKAFNKGTLITQSGNFQPAIRIALASGRLEWGIVGPADRKAYYYRGEAIDAAIRAGARAPGGQIAFADDFRQELSDFDVQTETLGEGHVRLVKILRPEIDPPSFLSSDISQEVAARFLPQEALETGPGTAIKNIIIVYVSFEAPKSFEELNEQASFVLEKTAASGGCIRSLHFDEKSPVMTAAFGVFAADAAQDEDARRALDFALETRERFKERVRLGIAGGRTIVGLAGARKRGFFITAGGAVNLAARALAGGLPGEMRTAGELPQDMLAPVPDATSVRADDAASVRAPDAASVRADDAASVRADDAASVHAPARSDAETVNSMSKEASLLASQGKRNEALALLKSALETCRSANLVPESAELQLQIGAIFFSRGELDRAQKCFDKALAVYRKIGNKSRIARTLLDLGAVLERRADFDAAFDLYGRSLTVAEESGDKAAVARALFGIGAAHCRNNRFDETIGYFEKSFAIMKEIGARDQYGHVFSYLTCAFAAQGQRLKALKSACNHFKNIKTLGLDVSAGRSHLGMALALTSGEGQKTPPNEMKILSEIEALTRIKSDPAAYFEAALDSARKADDENVLVPALCEYARYLCRTPGERDRASSLFREARDRARRAGMASELDALERECAELDGTRETESA